MLVKNFIFYFTTNIRERGPPREPLTGAMTKPRLLTAVAAVAQRVERRTVDPEVPGSNPGGGPLMIVSRCVLVGVTVPQSNAKFLKKEFLKASVN